MTTCSVSWHNNPSLPRTTPPPVCSCPTNTSPILTSLFPRPLLFPRGPYFAAHIKDGYVSLKPLHSKIQAMAMVIFFTAYMGVKNFALGVFVVSSNSALYPFLWIVIECWLLLLLRMSLKSWRFYRRGLDGAIVGFFMNIVLYTCLLSAPFPIIRMPNLLSPRIYVFGLLSMLLLNFAYVGVAHHYFNASLFIDEANCWVILIISTATCLLSGGVAFYFIPDSHKGTFYKNMTFAQYMKVSVFIEYLWGRDVFYR